MVVDAVVYYPERDMNTQTKYIEAIVSRLVGLDPYKIVLFGSQATGKPTEDSDIDLLVVLNSSIVSKTYEERIQKSLSVRDLILDINEQVPIDLLVYTKAEYEIIENAHTSFINEINNNGIVLYEKAS